MARSLSPMSEASLMICSTRSSGQRSMIAQHCIMTDVIPSLSAATISSTTLLEFIIIPTTHRKPPTTHARQYHCLKSFWIVQRLTASRTTCLYCERPLLLPPSSMVAFIYVHLLTGHWLFHGRAPASETEVSLLRDHVCGTLCLLRYDR